MNFKDKKIYLIYKILQLPLRDCSVVIISVRILILRVLRLPMPRIFLFMCFRVCLAGIRGHSSAENKENKYQEILLKFCDILSTISHLYYFLICKIVATLFINSHLLSCCFIKGKFSCERLKALKFFNELL